MKRRVSPNEGGCWFCFTKTDNMDYDSEFDTYLHRECLIESLQKADNPEAIIIGKYTYNDDPDVTKLAKIAEERSELLKDFI